MAQPASGADLPLFRFVQLEFPWELGPPDGRYVVRGHAGEVDQVVVTQTLGAAERRGIVRNRKPRGVAPEPEPTPVTVSRVTIVAPEPFTERDEGAPWLKSVDTEDETGAAVAVLNRLLHLYRTATADPYAREVAREQAICVRVGIGEGEQVAHGRWTDAVQLPPVARKRDTRNAALRPQERLAALLGGRDAALACEELILRARIDLDAGRSREAALQLRVALEAAIAELAPWAGQQAVADRLDGLRAERRAVGAAANRALEGGLDEEAIADLTRIVGLVESVLRARTAAGFS